MSTVKLRTDNNVQNTGSDAEPGASATQRVFNALREGIIQGQFAPDEKLKVESLKVLFNIGASPIREALSLLTSDQLVERIDQRGFRVASVSPEQFNEILSLRCQLESLALRESIDKGNLAWEESLVLAHHRLSKVSNRNTHEWEDLHKDFHAKLLGACESPILLRFCDQMYDLNVRYRNLAGSAVGYGQRNVAVEHEELLDAVLKRDADIACQRLSEHYARTGEFLLQHFSNDNCSDA